MKRLMMITVMVGLVLTGGSLIGPPHAPAADPTMDWYTAYPPFLDQAVAPNILFIVDAGAAALPAGYGDYVISFRQKIDPDTGLPFPDGQATWLKYSANVNVQDSQPKGLVASSPTVDNGNTKQAQYVIDNPKDVFDPNTEYYGFFDPYRCYVYGPANDTFDHGSRKTTVAEACGAAHWDGNFLNWLAARKKDLIYQIIVGGTHEPGGANDDGSADFIQGEKKTGIEGSGQQCKMHGDTGSESDPGEPPVNPADIDQANEEHKHSCWRYVKYVPLTTFTGTDGQTVGGYTGRVPTTLTADTAGSNATLTGTHPGRFFGVGEGWLYVNTDATPHPFDDSPYRFRLRVDLTTEPNDTPGTGLYTSNCIEGSLDYAGTTICYQRARSTGLFQNLREDNMRVAVMMVHDEKKNGGHMIYTFDDKKLSKKDSMKKIREKKSQENSGLSEALYEALCYFHKAHGPCYVDSKVHYDDKVGQHGDPYYFKDENQMVECCKSYVLMISPGEAFEDGFVPANVSDQIFGNPWVDTYTVPNPMTGVPSPLSNLGDTRPNDVGGRLDDIAYIGKVSDLRPGATAPAGLPGVQNVTFYAVSPFAKKSGADLLASAAKYGGFNDKDGDMLPDAAGQACTYPADSVLGTGASVSSSEWDENQDCVPDTFFEANSAAQIEEKVRDAVAAMLKHAASGSAISVLASSSTGEGAVFQSWFVPSTFEGLREVKWTGNTRGLFVDGFGNIREDTDGDGALVYDKDKILESHLDPVTMDVVVELFDDADGNGLKDSAVPAATVTLNDIKGIWEGGGSLADMTPCSRNIKTWIDTDNDGFVDGGEYIDFNADCVGKTDNTAKLAPFLRAQKQKDPADLVAAKNIINFVRGEQVAGMRDRQLTIGGVLKTWKLGDAIHSQPVLVGSPSQRYDVIYGDSTYTAFFQQYKSRRQVLYLGANDGMLHAFNGGFYHRGDDAGTLDIEHGYFKTTQAGVTNTPPLGEELFGFVPQELLPHLEWLTRSDYTHVYYVDLKPKVTDVRIFTPDADHPNGWGTILIGGFRLGGSCSRCEENTGANEMKWKAKYDGTTESERSFYSAYFVLDVTNPEAAGYPKLLWSFSHQDLGLTTSVPSVLRVSPEADASTDATNEKWYLVVGSGMTAYDGFSKQRGRMFAIDLKTGPESGATKNADLVKMQETKDDKAVVGDTLTIDRDFDYRVEVVYMGEAIEEKAPYKGKLLRWAMNTCTAPCSPDQWGQAKLPTVVLDRIATSEQIPIYAAPAVAIDESNKLWVFAGTGRFYAQADKADVDQRYFFGLKDPVLNQACTETSQTNCKVLDTNLVDVSNVKVCVIGEGDCGGTVDQVTGAGGPADVPSLLAAVAAKDGWYTTLPTTGERTLVRPAVIGGMVFFTSFVPPSNICETQGDSALYALHYLSGGPPATPVIGTTASGSEQYINRSIDLGKGMASEVVVHRGQGNSLGKATAYVQIDDSTIVSTSVNGLQPLGSRFVSWHYRSQ